MLILDAKQIEAVPLGMPEVIDIVGSHHERYDGNGYPRGLTGEDIPRMARIVSVADAFSAMVHDRPYRKGRIPEQALEILHDERGSQWDPEVVDAFVELYGGTPDDGTDGADDVDAEGRDETEPEEVR